MNPLNEVEQKLVATAVEKLLAELGVEHRDVAGMAPAQLFAIAKLVCEVAGIVCPIINKL